MERLLPILTLLVSSSWASLEMSRTTESVSAAPDRSMVISCKPKFDFPDECRFYTPDGQLVCPPKNDGMYWGVDDSKCLEDSNLKVQPRTDACSLQIKRVNPKDHFGDWKCEAGSWGDYGITMITLAQEQPVSVEFVDVWGTVLVQDTPEIQSDSSFIFKCLVLSEDGDELKSRPGEMTWKIGGSVVQQSEKYTRYESGEWIQEFEYIPRVKDHNKEVECVVKQGTEEKSDKVQLNVRIARPKKEDMSLTSQEGSPQTISFPIEIFPEPTEDNLFWKLETPTGEKVLKAGQSYGRFTVGEIIEISKNTFALPLTISKVAVWDENAKHKLVLDFEERGFAPLNFDLLVTVEKKQKPTPPPFVPTPATNPPRPTFPNSDSTPGVEEDETADGEKIVKAESSGGASLFIIIAIIVLVILLCIFYYCCKCCKKKNNDDSQPPTNEQQNKDVESAKLLEESKDETDKPRDQERSVTLKQTTENELITKLEPDAEKKPVKEVVRGQTAVISEDAEAEAAEEAKTKAVVNNDPLPTNDPSFNDENKEISQMANTIRQLSTGQDDSKDDENKAKKEPSSTPSTPATPPTSPAEPSKDDKSEESSKEEVKKAEDSQAARDKDWKANPLYVDSVDDGSKQPPNTSSPPASPASSKTGDEESHTWHPMDDEAPDSSKLLEQVEKIIEHVKSSNVDVSNNENATSSSENLLNKTPPKISRTSSWTQTPRLRHKGNDEFAFDSQGTSDDEVAKETSKA